ncbi:unknown [Clostridium sp. CAG:411]|jgi:hypothetical protein|nr:unknown [Clostridium sp. CAG:411]
MGQVVTRKNIDFFYKGEKIIGLNKGNVKYNYINLLKKYKIDGQFTQNIGVTNKMFCANYPFLSEKNSADCIDKKKLQDKFTL